MAKRAYDEAEDTSRPPKRAKPDQAHKSAPLPPPEIEEIHFAHQLSTLLTFHQTSPQSLRNGIASFKNFLESILYHRAEEDRGRQLSILREYLENQKASTTGGEEQQTPLLAQLFAGWGFANSNNNDYLASSVSAVLALLVKTLAGLLDFREFGVLVCRAVLVQGNLRLLKRNLDAPRHKEFVISPALRLLIEVTAFDGGVLAREVYKRREVTFQVNGLRRLLGLGRSHGVEEDRRRPSVRTLAVRYVLAHLKFQDEGGKIDVLRQKPVCSGLFLLLREDPAELVREMLAAVEGSVLKDQSLPRSAKGGLLMEHNLLRVLETARDHAGSEDGIEDFAYAWLRAVCTTPSFGILRSSGWYPPGTVKYEQQQSSNTIDLGLDSIPFYDGTESIQLRNTILSNWLPNLKPQSSTSERDLLLECFKSAPELVTPYFQERAAHMQMEPKLTNTWIGYASFMLEATALPIPSRFGHTEGEGFAQLPPQTSIVVESLLPKPLNQKVLTRCLNQSSDLITFFTMRLLIVSLQKLAKVLAGFSKAEQTSTQPSLWAQASEKLLNAFTARCPPMTAAVEAFRKTPDDETHILQRKAATHLLRLFHEVTPVQALEQQFDVSTALTTALERSENATASEADSEVSRVRAAELQHLLSIAGSSHGMRWFDVPKKSSLRLSPVVALLKLHAREGQSRDGERRAFIEEIVVANDVINKRSESAAGMVASPIDALVGCLMWTAKSGGQQTDETWNFLQDCFARVAKAPVKYLDIAEGMQKRREGGESATRAAGPSVLAAVMHEQRPFAVKREEQGGQEVTPLISMFLAALVVYCGERIDAVEYVDKPSKLAETLPKELEELVMEGVEEQTTNEPIDNDALENGETSSPIPFDPLPVESDSHPELLRWTKKDLDIALEDGDIDALILCLSSKDPSIQHQAKTQLTALSNKVYTSDHEHKTQLYLLLGELLETYTLHTQHAKTKGTTTPTFPYLATTFANAGLHILLDPTHFLYSKLNTHLLSRPSWSLTKLPQQWLHSALHSPPSDDDAHWKETQWVLSWLVAGLRTQADLELLRRGQVFERVLALYFEPGASGRFVKDRVLELLWRGVGVGAGTVVTRTGVLGFLDIAEEKEGDEGRRALLGALRKGVLDECEGEEGKRVGEWSGVEVGRM